MNRKLRTEQIKQITLAETPIRRDREMWSGSGKSVCQTAPSPPTPPTHPPSSPSTINSTRAAARLTPRDASAHLAFKQCPINYRSFHTDKPIESLGIHSISEFLLLTMNRR